MKKTIRLFLPLLVLLFVGVFLLRGLWLDPRKLPSVFIDKPLPAFQLPLLADISPTVPVSADSGLLSKQNFEGKPWVLNVFASWCQACIVEHPHLLELARRNQILLVGLAYKDEPSATRAWLAKHGNPYDIILEDQSGRAGIDFGVYGVPETFVLDEQGIVKSKHVGPIDPTFFNQQVLPVLQEPGASRS
ncbi:MAG: DsbE family thiol:disulfide interchange protein [Limnobacter sp.]|nr:DsbE family thiol:disulfide interchange protein [Limnobacter sp.]